MVDRITLLLKAKNINASQFADEIGVQRSSISHVLSGRNKPSLEFIQKILKRYQEINPDWLLFGKGPMNMEFNLFSETTEGVPLKEELISKALTKQESMMRQVPEEKQDFQVTNVSSPAEKEKEEAKPESNPVVINNETEVKQDHLQHITPVQNAESGTVSSLPEAKQVEKILIFFNNRTFREYLPE
jgi:transcriptional regulator with XRE-family HTH domain